MAVSFTSSVDTISTIPTTWTSTVTTTVSSSLTTLTTTHTSSNAVVVVYTSTLGQLSFVSFSQEVWTFPPSPTTPTTTPTSISTSSPGPTTATSAPASTEPSSRPPHSATTSNAPQPTQTDHSSALSRGAIAGIGVGCAVAGLLLGLIAGFLLFRRRRRQRPAIAYQTTQFDSQTKPLQETPTDRLDLDQFLLDATPDADIRTELRSLSHLLQQHVENNYHLQPVSHSANELSQVLLKLGLGQGGAMTALKLASLSLDPTHRHNAIQHVIARVVFTSVAFNEAAPYSLLPQPVSSFTSMIPAVEGRRGNTNGKYRCSTSITTMY